MPRFARRDMCGRAARDMKHIHGRWYARDMQRFASEVFAFAKVKLLRSEVCAKGTSEVLALPKWRQRDELSIKHIPIPRPLVLSGSESTYPSLISEATSLFIKFTSLIAPTRVILSGAQAESNRGAVRGVTEQDLGNR